MWCVCDDLPLCIHCVFLHVLHCNIESQCMFAWYCFLMYLRWSSNVYSVNTIHCVFLHVILSPNVCLADVASQCICDDLSLCIHCVFLHVISSPNVCFPDIAQIHLLANHSEEMYSSLRSSYQKEILTII